MQKGQALTTMGWRNTQSMKPSIYQVHMQSDAMRNWTFYACRLTKLFMRDCVCVKGNGRFNLLIILLSGILLMGATVENISIAFVLPYANCDLNMTTTEFGLVASSAFLGIVISSHLWGFFADLPSFGRQKVIRLTATGALISALLSAFSPNATVLILLRFIVGILWVNPFSLVTTKILWMNVIPFLSTVFRDFKQACSLMLVNFIQKKRHRVLHLSSPCLCPWYSSTQASLASWWCQWIGLWIYTLSILHPGDCIWS